VQQALQKNKKGFTSSLVVGGLRCECIPQAAAPRLSPGLRTKCRPSTVASLGAQEGHSMASSGRQQWVTLSLNEVLATGIALRLPNVRGSAGSRGADWRPAYSLSACPCHISRELTLESPRAFRALAE